MGRVLAAVSLLLWLSCGCQVQQAPVAPAPVSYLFASQPGKETLDQGSGGGNPFASALITALTEPSDDLRGFSARIDDLTRANSYDFQAADIDLAEQGIQIWSPLSPTESRIALVFVFSQYEAGSRLPPLAGAGRDAARLDAAFLAAGFDTTVVVDPTLRELEGILADFARQSAAYDTAAIYATGHGVENLAGLYLIPLEYDLARGSDGLEAGAVNVRGLGAFLTGRERNLVFYGACRNDPFAPAED